MKQEFEGNYEEVVDNFDNMNLQEDLLRGIYAYGFEKPSAIQQRAIMPLVKGLDIIAQAQSGTGKKREKDVEDERRWLFDALYLPACIFSLCSFRVFEIGFTSSRPLVLDHLASSVLFVLLV